MKHKIFLLLLAIVASLGVATAKSFAGFEASNENKMGNQIYSQGLIQNTNNITLIETDVTKHKYNINLTNGGEGTFQMYSGAEVSVGDAPQLDTLTVARALEIGKALAEGESTDYYAVKGFVASIIADYEDELQSFVLSDDKEATWGEFRAIDALIDDPGAKLHDEILLIGKIENVHNVIRVVKGHATVNPDPTPVSGTSYNIGDLYYYLDAENKTAEVARSNSYSGSIIIPESVVYNATTYRVTSIGAWAFQNCTGLTSVTIPNSVTSIGCAAFSGCSGLPSPVYNSHVFAFLPTSYSGAYTIPNGIESIAAGAFLGCTGLTSVVIPNSVTSIGESAFHGCTGLTSVVIPNSVTSIGESAFFVCTGLTSITISNSVTSIRRRVFTSCTGLTSVTIPNSVTTIEDDAFNGCDGLTSVTIGSGITYIGGLVFANCRNLTEVTIEATTPPTLQYNSFYDVQSFYVPCGSLEAYKSAPSWSWRQSQIKYKLSLYTITAVKTEGGRISMPEELTICDEKIQLTAIPDRGCYFVRWADGNTDNPRAIELTQDTTMEAIFDYLLSGKCGKDNVLTWKFDPLTKALDITGKGALSENYTYGTFIESLTIGNEVTSVGQSAFYGCNNLKNVILGSSVKVLEEAAFYDCSAIKTITCYSQRPPTVNNYALYGLDYSTIVYVPADYLNTYKMHDAWGLYDVRPLEAKPTETTDVVVTPSETTTEIVWPVVTGAASYELVIKDANGNVICTLTFNEKGQLTSIAFNAPGRNESQQTQSAGFAFTVTGLEPGTQYSYSITAKNASGATLHTETGTFTTKALEALEQITNDKCQMTNKVLRDGQVFILRGNKTYTTMGQEVR